MRYLMTAVFIIAMLTIVGCSVGTMLSQNGDGGGVMNITTSVRPVGEI